MDLMIQDFLIFAPSSTVSTVGVEERCLSLSTNEIAAIACVLIALIVPVALVFYLKNRYFTSEEFLTHKDEVSTLVSEYNEIADYIEDVRRGKSFEIGESNSGMNSHLASFENTSRYNYRRDKNVSHYKPRNVHNCSLQVVKNASSEPIKYVLKYFNIKPNEQSLLELEMLGENISNLENALTNLEQRRNEIVGSFTPPLVVRLFFKKELMSKIGTNIPKVTVPYPVYVFEYVSAGGNSSQKTVVTLNSQTIDAMIETISERIRFRKSVAGQRALMTSPMRESIKERDGYTCQMCSVSLEDEPHLLLEVDHIIPLSKGGLSTEDNLQTLCWKCNRSKSNKILES